MDSGKESADPAWDGAYGSITYGSITSFVWMGNARGQAYFQFGIRLSFLLCGGRGK